MVFHQYVFSCDLEVLQGVWTALCISHICKVYHHCGCTCVSPSQMIEYTQNHTGHIWMASLLKKNEIHIILLLCIYIYIYTDNVFLYWKYILLYWKYCYIYTVAFHNTCSFLNFTCVNAVMPLQIIIADKRFVTLVTFVRLFPGVSKHMTGEFSRSFKSFITIILGTFVWFFFLVNTTVYPLKKKDTNKYKLLIN